MVRPGCYSHILCNKTLYHNTFISFEIRVLAKLRVSSSKLPTCFRFGLADGIGDGVVPEGVAVAGGGLVGVLGPPVGRLAPGAVTCLNAGEAPPPCRLAIASRIAVISICAGGIVLLYSYLIPIYFKPNALPDAGSTPNLSISSFICLSLGYNCLIAWS